jgi:hypothetical protein
MRPAFSAPFLLEFVFLMFSFKLVAGKCPGQCPGNCDQVVAVAEFMASPWYCQNIV